MEILDPNQESKIYQLLFYRKYYRGCFLSKKIKILDLIGSNDVNMQNNRMEIKSGVNSIKNGSSNNLIESVNNTPKNEKNDKSDKLLSRSESPIPVPILVSTERTVSTVVSTSLLADVAVASFSGMNNWLKAFSDPGPGFQNGVSTTQNIDNNEKSSNDNNSSSGGGSGSGSNNNATSNSSNGISTDNLKKVSSNGNIKNTTTPPHSNNSNKNNSNITTTHGPSPGTGTKSGIGTGIGTGTGTLEFLLLSALDLDQDDFNFDENNSENIIGSGSGRERGREESEETPLRLTDVGVHLTTLALVPVAIDMLSGYYLRAYSNHNNIDNNYENNGNNDVKTKPVKTVPWLLIYEVCQNKIVCKFLPRLT